MPEKQFDGGYQLTFWPDTPGFESGVFGPAPRQGAIADHAVCMQPVVRWTKADRRNEEDCIRSAGIDLRRSQRARPHFGYNLLDEPPGKPRPMEIQSRGRIEASWTTSFDPRTRKGRDLRRFCIGLLVIMCACFLWLPLPREGEIGPQTRDSTDTSRGGLTASASGMMPQRGRRLHYEDRPDRTPTTRRGRPGPGGIMRRSSYAPDRPRTRGQGSD